jgi:hypothetical protein
LPRPKEIAEPIREYQGQAISFAKGIGSQPRLPSHSAIMSTAEHPMAQSTSGCVALFA